MWKVKSVVLISVPPTVKMPRTKRAAAIAASKTRPAGQATSSTSRRTAARGGSASSSRTSRAKQTNSGEMCTDGRSSIWTPEKTVCEARRIFEANSDPDYAVWIKKYMRDQFEFHGLRSPIRRQLGVDIFKTVGLVRDEDEGGCWSGEQVHTLIRLLWKQPERDYQMFALDVARKVIDKTLYDFKQAAALCRFMISEKSWWDTVDEIANHLVGGLVLRYPSQGLALMNKWIKDDHLWIRRSAIIHQLSYRKNCKQDVLFRYCLACAHETDFFIRKAIGWALRQHAYVNPSAVKGFIRSNDEKLSPLSKKEGLKHLGGWPMKS